MAVLGSRRQKERPTDELGSLEARYVELQRRIADLESTHAAAQVEVERLVTDLGTAILDDAPADDTVLAGARERLATLAEVLVAARSAASETAEQIEQVRQHRQRLAMADKAEARANLVSEALANFLVASRELSVQVRGAKVFGAEPLAAGIQQLANGVAEQLGHEVVNEERSAALSLRQPAAARPQQDPAAQRRYREAAPRIGRGAITYGRWPIVPSEGCQRDPEVEVEPASGFDCRRPIVGGSSMMSRPSAGVFALHECRHAVTGRAVGALEPNAASNYRQRRWSVTGNRKASGRRLAEGRGLGR